MPSFEILWKARQEKFYPNVSLLCGFFFNSIFSLNSNLISLSCLYLNGKAQLTNKGFALRTIAAMQFACRYAPIFFNSAPLLRMSLMAAPLASSSMEPMLGAEPERLSAIVQPLQELFTDLPMLLQEGGKGMTLADWGRVIHCIILAVRLCFPFPGLDGFDHTRARERLDFIRFCDAVMDVPSPSPNTRNDDNSGSSERPGSMASGLDMFKLVMSIIRKKYVQKVEALKARRELAAERAGLHTIIGESMSPWNFEELGDMGKIGCPIMDGSLDSYVSLWNGEDEMSMSHAIGTSVGETGNMESVTSMSSVGPSSLADFDFLSCSGNWDLPSTENATVLTRETELARTTTAVHPTPLFHDLWAPMPMTSAEFDMSNAIDE